MEGSLRRIIRKKEGDILQFILDYLRFESFALANISEND